jgi:AraC-like DNA-binding protein
LFVRLPCLLQNGSRRRLASCGYQSTPEIYASEPLNHILNHISRNLGSDLRADELAELSGFSPSGFSRAFEQHTGLTFVRYVNQMRINRACELLIGKTNVADICFQVGFNNLSNFNRQFLKLKGISPSGFRHHGDARRGRVENSLLDRIRSAVNEALPGKNLHR